MVNSNQQRPSKSGLLPLLLTIGGFCLFAIIIAFVWNDKNPSAIASGGRSAADRLESLRAYREKSREDLTTYGWVNQEKGVVRIPIEQAMELSLKELNQGQTQN